MKIKLKILIFLMIIILISGCPIIKKPILTQNKILLDDLTDEGFKKFEDIETKDVKESFLITLPENGASFPKNFAPPEFEWEPYNNKIWFLMLNLPNGEKLSVLTKNNFWMPSQELWDQIKKISEGKFSDLIIYGSDGNDFSKSQKIKFRISPFPTDQFVVFRIAKYQPNLFYQLPNIYYRDISKLDSEVLFKSTDFCFACHTFSKDNQNLFLSTRRGNGTILGADLIIPNQEETYLEIEGESGSKNIIGSIIGSWTSRGDKILLAVNQKNLPHNITSDRTTDTYYTEGDLAVFDIKTKKLSLLPGASDPSKREFFPDISPDDKSISFSVETREEGDEVPTNSDIYVIPFNDGRGGEARPLKGASEKGFREYFQRYSPDGKWITFNRVEGGKGDIFTELSDIYILPAEGGEPKRLECNAEGVLDSLAIWSSNSRWIVFDSRRYKTESRLYFAEISEDGDAYPPVKMPNSEIGEKLAYHQPAWVKDGRALMSIMKEYNRYNRVMEEKFQNISIQDILKQ